MEAYLNQLGNMPAAIQAHGGEWECHAGDAPPARKLHSATAAASEGEIIIFGGQALESGTDLNDLYYLIKVGNIVWELAYVFIVVMCPGGVTVSHTLCACLIACCAPCGSRTHTCFIDDFGEAFLPYTRESLLGCAI